MQLMKAVSKQATLAGLIRACIAVSLVGLVLIPPAASAQDAPAGQDKIQHESTREVTIPLDEGQLDVGDFLGVLLDEIGLDGDAARRRIDWSIDVTGMLGRGPIKAIDAATSDVLTIEVRDDAVAILFDEAELKREERKIREDISRVMRYWFPEAAAGMRLNHGFTIYTENQRKGVDAARFKFNPENVAPREYVILIHGLDEPGHIWNQLRPALLDEGFIVCEFWYPNDQAIARSARYFADELRGLRAQGLPRASVVAHSMGGLVAREVLTNSKWYAGDARGGSTWPAIEHFIMVGTPNHGSPMARLRFATEIREQIIRAFRGEGNLFDGFFDGSGEAKNDLLPESEFLTSLNARPLPRNVDITIIAGKASPIDRGEVRDLIERIAPKLPEGSGETVDELAEGLMDVTEGFGDGVVSIESTKLQGVDDHAIVPGSHVSMIRNYPYHDDDRVPPAAPIIMERLKGK